MALLTTQIVSVAGIAQTLAAATAGGDTFFPNDVTILVVKNGDGSPHTVTVVSPVNCDQGFEHDVAVVVAAGATELIGPFPAGRFAAANGQGSITYSAVTSVTIAAVQVPHGIG